jgi:endonuclease/exonuclease/phosphatase family metal-dependent hydrolase
MDLRPIVFLLASLAFCQETLKMGTFNCEFLLRERVHIKYGFPFDLAPEQQAIWAEEGFREQQFQKAIQGVADYLLTLNCDVLALQEVGDAEDIGELQRVLGEKGSPYPYWTVSDSQSDSGQHVALFSKRPYSLASRRIPGVDLYFPELDDVDDERLGALEKGLHGIFEIAGEKIHVLVVHLVSERKGHESDALRLAQANVVRRYYLPFLQEKEHVILMGDLNDHRGQPAVKRIRGLDDLGPDLLQTGLTPYFEPAQWSQRWTYEFRGMRHQLDYILPSTSLLPFLRPEMPIVCRVPDDLSWHRASLDRMRLSDHRPFLATFHFKGAQP